MIGPQVTPNPCHPHKGARHYPRTSGALGILNRLNAKNLGPNDHSGPPAVNPLLFVLGACAFYILAGCLFVPYIGVQNDEALFGNAIYPPLAIVSKLRIFHRDLPLMVMSYVGTWKSWVYWILFQLWQPSAYSVRLPTIVTGAATIWTTYRFTTRAIGCRAGLIVAALLAADTSFLLTNTFDWGPVAFQHLFFTAGLAATLWFYQTLSSRTLCLSWFCFGLGMWDKALFVWLLSATVVATVVVFPRVIRRHVTWTRVVLAVLSFVIGALPLVIYNSRKPTLQTFRGNTHLTLEELPSKPLQVQLTLEGRNLFGYLVNEDFEPSPRTPRTAVERASVGLSQFVGVHRAGFLGWALLATLPLALLWWSTPFRSAMLFSYLFLLIAWLQMALTRGAGGAAHHVVLLWPIPHFAVAAALAASVDRLQSSSFFRLTPKAGSAALVVIVALICGQAILVTNQYLSQAIRNGGAGNWSDAIYPLAEKLKTIRTTRTFVLDWGILNSVRLLNRGAVDLVPVNDPFMDDQPSASNREFGLLCIRFPGAIFVSHVPGKEEFSGVYERSGVMAGSVGYHRDVIDRISDSNGRPVFEIFRFLPGETASSTKDASPASNGLSQTTTGGR